MIGNKLIESIRDSLSDSSAFEIDTTQIIKAQIEAEKYVNSLTNVDEANKEIIKSALNKATSEKMASVAMNVGTVAIQTQTVAQKALNIARATGNTLLSAGIGVVVGMMATGFVTWLMDVAHAEERVAEAAQNAKGHIKELNDNFNSQKAIVDEAIESYDKLAQGVDIVTNQNISLSTEDYEKFLDLNNQLVEIFPDLYDGLDENGNAILNLGENGKTAAEGLKEALNELQNLNNYKISQELPDLFAGVQQQLDKARESAQEFETEYAEMQKSLGQMQALSMQGIEFTDNQFSVSGSINDSGLVEYMSLIEQSYNEFLNSLSDERLIELNPSFNISSNIDDITGEKSLTINIPWDQLLEDEQSEWESIIKENAQEMAFAYTDEINSAFADNAQLQKEAELEWKDFLPSLISTMESKATFQELEELGDNTQDIVRDIVGNLTVDAYDDMGSDPYAWIRSNIIAPLTELSDSDRQKVIQSYEKLLNFNADEVGVNAQEVQAYVDNLINQIATLLGQDPIELKVNLGLENVVDQDVVSESQRLTRQLIEQSTGTSSSSTIPEERQLYQNELSSANEKINELSINTTEETIAWNEALVEALENHEDLEYAIDVYNKKLENTVSESNTLSFGKTITELDEMTSKFDQLDESYAKFADGDKDTNVNFEDYAAIQEAFKDVEGIDAYIQRLQEVNGNAVETQQVFDELATALIEQFDLSENLTEENAGLIAEYLELKGVVNANEIVYGQLQAQQMANTLGIQNLTNATIESLDATYSQINGLLGEADASGIATTALYQLISQQTIFSNSSLNTSQKIQELEKLAKAFGITADSAQVATAQANMASEISIAARNGDTESIAAIQDAYLAEIGSYYEDAIEARFGNLSASYTGGTATQSAIDKAGSKAKDEAEKQFDWIETRLERLKAQREELNEFGSSSIVDFFGISQEDLDRAKELFSMSLSPGSQEVNELVDIANRAKMSIGELQQLVQSGASANNRESYLQQVLNKDRELIETNKLAIAAYKAEYDSVKGLVSPEIQAKIESGDINIEEYSGDEAENIEKVQDAYEKYSDSVSNQRDLENQLYEDTRSYYENRINYINAQNTAIENSNNLIQAQMDYMQEAGEIVTASSYEQLIDNLDRQISLMEKRKAEQEAELQALINSEDFDMGEDSEAYYELQDSIADTEAEIIDLETAQEEYNNTLLQMPIDNMDILLNMYQSITTEIENWGATLEASGKKLNQNYYQTLINNGMEIIDQYEEQADLIEDIMDEYDEGSDQWNELYDRLQNVNSEMSSMVQNLYEWNEALLQLPLDSINDYANNLQQIADAMSEVMSEYNTVIDAVVGAIDNEIDAINDEKDDVNDAYQDRIDALQDQLDLLDEQNEKKQLQLDLEQAQYELEQLRNQKTIRVIREGRVTYENDADSIRDAQNAVDDAEYNIMRDELEGQIEDLQDELDDINKRYDDQIERLEEIANKWEEIRTNVEQYNKELIASDYLGEGWQDKVISGNDQDIYEMFKNMYESLNNQQNAYNKQIENTQNISELLNSYIEAYKEGTITYQEAMTGMKDVLSQINEHTTALDNLQNILDFSGVSNDTANNAESVLGAIQDSLTETANELLKSFETYNENSGLITEYTSSWEQLTNNVDDIKDTLEDVRDNLEDALEEARDRDEEEDDDDDSGNRGATGLHSYKGPLSYDKGIANGLVGSGSESSREDKMKLLGLRPLNEDEVIRILHKGEAVFNPDQQNQLLRNFETAYNAAIPKVAMPNIPNITPANTSNNVEISMGDVILPNVQDVDGFAKAIGTRFGAVLRQEVGRNIK